MTDSCTSGGCHQDMSSKANIHPAAADDGCVSCHEPQDDQHIFKFTAEGQELCYACHDAVDDKKNVHEGVRDNCTMCHDPHQSDAEYLIKTPEVSGVCYQCHDQFDTEDGKMTLHGPVAAGECNNCHNPHSSDLEQLLVARMPDLCVRCHDDVGEEISKQVVHPPATSSCTECHDPHLASQKHLLRAKPPQLCNQCHEDKIDEQKTVHGPLTDSKSCLNCHRPHGTDQESLLTADPGELCLKCHSKRRKTADGRKIENIGKLLRSSPYVHPPAAEKECLSCHVPHSSKRYTLLSEDFPQTMYCAFVPEKYELCWQCHDKALVEKKSTTEDTQFRNGETNLHFLHVDREKGRSCRMCHAAHASSQPALIKRAIKFGKWRMPVKFAPTPSGGRCAPGCHAEYRYDRDQPVDYSKKSGSGF